MPKLAQKLPKFRFFGCFLSFVLFSTLHLDFAHNDWWEWYLAVFLQFSSSVIVVWRVSGWQGSLLRKNDLCTILLDFTIKKSQFVFHYFSSHLILFIWKIRCHTWSSFVLNVLQMIFVIYSSKLQQVLNVLDHRLLQKKTALRPCLDFLPHLHILNFSTRSFSCKALKSKASSSMCQMSLDS